MTPTITANARTVTSQLEGLKTACREIGDGEPANTAVMRASGHSYLMDSATVLKDIQFIIRQKLSAKQRGLAEAGKLPDLYWRLP